MDRRPGEPGRPGGIGVEMQRIVVAGNGRITRERFPRKRPEALRMDLVPGPWPIRRRRLHSGFDHDAGSKLSGTMRSTVSSCAQISPWPVETSIFKVNRGGFAVRRTSTERT